MKTTVLGYPRIGAKRELKKAVESFWKKKLSTSELEEVARKIRRENWKVQQDSGIDLVPVNDFSLYDQVLDMIVTLGCIPEEYNQVKNNRSELDLYFSMARGLQDTEYDVKALEMTKWFDTNYHYLVPEFVSDQKFTLNATKIIEEVKEAKSLGLNPKPVIIGPTTFLLLGKEKEANFSRISLLKKLLPAYGQLIKELQKVGVEYIQFDEPILATDLTVREQQSILDTYSYFKKNFPYLKIILANYFDCYGDNLDLALSLPVDTLHLDLVRCPSQLGDVLSHSSLSTNLSLGIVDGRNIWKNNFNDSLSLINEAVDKIGSDRIWLSSSCSLLHSPYDLELEQDEDHLSFEIKKWLAFAKQKVAEITTLRDLALGKENQGLNDRVFENEASVNNRRISTLIHDLAVKERVQKLSGSDCQRISSFSERQKQQELALGLPYYPTTTIGSFPQTKEVRKWRSRFKKGEISPQEYENFIKNETRKTITFQESVGLDLLVHGEFERNDMVEYFGEKLKGIGFTQFGWVQSYGTRCVKPPIIYGDVSRPEAMTVKWSTFAQSLTNKPVKGMLTGPITILHWSFVRNDQPRSLTCKQIALAIRDEVVDLEKAGLKAIQIDEPAIREGLPLRKADWDSYLDWAVDCFKIAAGGVKDETQIHTHMCYSEFNDIIRNIADMDADVITIETSRSEMELLDAFVDFKYPNEIGPGVYDIHSPRIPSISEIENLLQKASALLPSRNIWVNPDCGLKTREWPETKKALENLVSAARKMRQPVELTV